MYSPITPHRISFPVRCFFFISLFYSTPSIAFSGLSLDASYHHSLQKINENFVSEKKLGIEWAPTAWMSATRSHHPIFRISTSRWLIAKENLNASGAGVGYCHFSPNYQRSCILSGLSNAKCETLSTNIFQIELQFSRFIGPDFTTALDLSYFDSSFDSTKGLLVGLTLGQNF